MPPLRTLRKLRGPRSGWGPVLCGLPLARDHAKGHGRVRAASVLDQSKYFHYDAIDDPFSPPAGFPGTPCT